METHRLIKDYFFYPFLVLSVIFTFFHWYDSQSHSFEQSIIFGLIFGGGLSLIIGFIIIIGIKFIRPKLNKKFAKHKRLDGLKEHGFKLNKEHNTYTGKVRDFDAQFYYGFEESDILTSRYHIVIIFKPISKEKHKSLKPQRLFDHTFLGSNHMIGYHEFKLIPPKTIDLLADANAFCAYLRNHDIEPEKLETTP